MQKIVVDINTKAPKLFRTYLTVPKTGRDVVMIDIGVDDFFNSIKLDINDAEVTTTANNNRYEHALDDSLLANSGSFDIEILGVTGAETQTLGVIRLYVVVSETQPTGVQIHASKLETEVTGVLNNVINLQMSTSLKHAKKHSLPLVILSQDINNNQFIINFVNDTGEAITLDERYTVEIFSVFTQSKTSALTPGVIANGKVEWSFDTSYINQSEFVHNFVYVRKTDGELLVSADANAFTFYVGMSEIDKGAGKVAETYDYNYAEILKEFEERVGLTAEEIEGMVQAEIGRVQAEIDREATFDQLVEDGVIETNIAERLENLESEYAPKLTELEANDTQLTAQLAQTNVLSAEAVAKADAMASGSPKEVYATLALLQASYPTGTTGAFLVSADGKWYYWSGSAWTIGGIYQSTGIADGSINNQKLSSDFSTFSGYRANARTANTGIMNVSITPVFDTNGLTLTVGDRLRVEYELYTEDATLLNSSILTFANNDSTPSVYTGGYSGAQTTKITLAKSKLVKFDVLTPYAQNDAYRYVKPFIYIETNDPAINHLVYIRNIKAYIGAVELPQINLALTFSSPTYSTISQHTAPMPTQIPRFMDLSTVATTGDYADLLNKPALSGVSRWSGKKANFLGDSVTAGVGVMLESDRFVNKVATALGLASFANYGQSGTRITEQGGTGTSFVERYTAMSNDADLIFVFGITNDYWSGTGVFGVETSTTISEYYGALNTLITGLQNKYIGKEIVFILPYNQYWQTVTSDNPNAASGQNLEGYVNAAKKRCAYHGIPVLDLFTSSGMDAAHNANHRTTYIPDGVHPNIAGAQRIAYRVCGLVNSI